MRKMLKNNSSEKRLVSIKARLFYLDVLRIVACFAVVCIHVISRAWYTTNVNSEQWAYLNAFDSALRWCVPVFVMISGALFLRDGKSESFFTIMRKRVLKVFLAFCLASTLYAAWDVILGKVSGMQALLLDIVSGRNHLWFLYMLVGLYLVTPFCRVIAADANLLKSFLLLSCIFSFALPSATVYLTDIGDLTGSPLMGCVSRSLELIQGKMSFSFTLNYVSYYMLGYYLSTAKFSKTFRTWLYTFGAASLLFTFAFTQYMSRFGGVAYEGAYGYLTLNVAILSSSVFVAGRYCFDRVIPSDSASCAMQLLSQSTFLLYLLHQFVLDILIDLIVGNSVISTAPLVFVPLLSTLGFVLSLVLALISSSAGAKMASLIQRA